MEVFVNVFVGRSAALCHCHFNYELFSPVKCQFTNSEMTQSAILLALIEKYFSLSTMSYTILLYTEKS